jgi:RNA polymerase sigma-70 factor (ECF subfamily)
MQQGSEQALTELFRRYYTPLYIKAYKRIPFVYQAEEIVQDVFVNIWLKASMLDVTGNVKAYLYATLRNKILHELRTEATRAFHAEKLAEMTKQQHDDRCLDAINAKQTEQYISEVIAGLSPHCREAFLLSRFEHLSYKEIAERMHISINTVEKHVSKALRILKSKLNEYDDLIFFLLLVSFLPI